MLSVFAQKLAVCGACAEQGATLGLRAEWAAVEHIVHDMGHLVALGLRLPDRCWLADVVNEALEEFPKPLQLLCEAEAIALQVHFFRRVRGFLDDDEAMWTRAVCSKQSVPQVLVRLVSERPQTARMERILYSRLRGFTRGVSLEVNDE